MNIEQVIGDAARDHKLLLEVDPAKKGEQGAALKTLKGSIDALSRDLAQLAFQGGRSKRKQWAEVQKQVTDLYQDGEEALGSEEQVEPEAVQKIELRYQRLQTRILRLSGE